MTSWFVNQGPRNRPVALDRRLPFTQRHCGGHLLGRGLDMPSGGSLRAGSWDLCAGSWACALPVVGCVLLPPTTLPWKGQRRLGGQDQQFCLPHTPGGSSAPRRMHSWVQGGRRSMSLDAGCFFAPPGTCVAEAANQQGTKQSGCFLLKGLWGRRISGFLGRLALPVGKNELWVGGPGWTHPPSAAF